MHKVEFKVEVDAPALYSYQTRLSPEMVLYKSEDNGKIIIYDEGAKKMLEMDPKSLKMMK
ncbi:hypothetical protein SANA_25140 [Gottschalkiaceae bacterium SANA]|nr:hypothetical protein SANA_25140 [Gottschalkiaceae bacterium SANA]